MNTGQMLLTLGAIILFGMGVLRLNTSELDTGQRVDNSKYSIMALALAKSRIDDAKALKFDANTVYGTVYPDVHGDPPTGSLTASGGLGPSNEERNSGEFNDFDDYHNFVEVVDTIPSANFRVVSTVQYVDAEDGYRPTTATTWHKRIRVVVTSENLAEPVVLSSINSYWKF